MPPINPPAYQQILSTLNKALNAGPDAVRESIQDEPLATLLDAMDIRSSRKH
jgi:hypothetical protein